jgi:multiple sugar transport system ATP-binding protein
VAEITLEHVTKEFAAGIVAVDDVNLTIADGEFMVLVGPSGCGKSTLLRMIAGLEEITDGTISIGDRDVTDLSPPERDIAMVFQNYALYPHMNVRENLGFGLSVRHTPKPEIRRRVEDVATLLGLENLLDRKPAHLSGGQRQRVAMGRAIVREPVAFLMDEPLSNLDAKLRVQMRAEIARIQRVLAVTTIYVTHDQWEAMTLGDRVCVMRDGLLQQVDSPQRLYDVPVNLFVAEFIGSPSMNLVEAELTDADGGVIASFGPHRLRLGEAVLKARPALRGYVGGTVALGIRPEDMEDASVAGAADSLKVRVDIREDMGSEVYLHFGLDAPPVRNEEVIAAASTEGDEAAASSASVVPATPFVARVDRMSSAREGETVELAVETDRLHLFDLVSGLGIYREAREPALAPA